MDHRKFGDFPSNIYFWGIFQCGFSMDLTLKVELIPVVPVVIQEDPKTTVSDGCQLVNWSLSENGETIVFFQTAPVAPAFPVG